MEYGKLHMAFLDKIGVPPKSFISLLNEGDEKKCADLLEKIITQSADNEEDAEIAYELVSLIPNLKKKHTDGGPGSGNWGHSGRPGKVGGSEGDGGIEHRITTKTGDFTSKAKEAEKKQVRYSVNKEGRLFVARSESGYAICSGSDRDYVEKSAKKAVEEKGPLLGMKSGETRTFSAAELNKAGLTKAIQTAASGSKVKTESGATYEKKGSNWSGYDKGFYSGSKGLVSCSSDVLLAKGVQEVTYIKK